MTQNRQRALVFGVSLYLVWIMMALVFPLLPSPWPPFYWALPVHGQVVDADTGTPLSGVIVAAHWELRTVGWSPRVTGQAAVMEDVTDVMGRFSFRWWHPRLRWPWEGHLESDAPGLLLFRSGYEWTWCHNSFAPSNFNPFPGSDCDGAILKLKKFQGSEQEYAEHLRTTDNELGFAFQDRSCWWKNIPHMLVALHEARLHFDAKGIHLSTGKHNSIADWEHLSQCGSVHNYLRSYLP